MISRHNRALVLWAMVSAVLLVGLSTWYLSEPKHEGRTPREWLREAVELGPRPRGSRGGTEEWNASFEACGVAFQQLGRRGIRLLVNEFLQRQPIHLEWYDRAARALNGVITLPVTQPPQFRQERIVARELLLRVGHAAAPDLLRATYSRSPEVRGLAANLLGELGPGNPTAQRRLLALRQDSSDQVIYRSLEVVWMTLPEPDTAVPLILPFLTHTNQRVRVEASYAIGSLRPLPDLTLQSLLTALSDTHGTVRANAARAIGLTGQRSETVVTALDRQLDDTNEVSRFRAAEALARLLDHEESRRHERLLEVVAEAETSDRDYFRLIGFNARTAMEGAEGPVTSMIDTFWTLLSNPTCYIRRDGIDGIELYLEACRNAPDPQLESLLLGVQKDPNGLIRHLARNTLDTLAHRARLTEPREAIHTP